MVKLKLFPNYVSQLLMRLGITLLMMTIVRIIFFIANYNAFSGVVYTDFLAGIWVDAITIGIWFIPFYGFSLIPNPWRQKKWYQVVLKSIFHIINTGLLVFNLIDVEYFKFTSKRSTSDLFTIVGAGQDFSQLIGTFAVDFWWLILIFILLILVSNWLYNKTYLPKESTVFSRIYWLKEISFFVIGSAFLFVIGRGGFGYRPADMMTAATFTEAQNTPLVLNTGLSIIKTLGKEPLKLAEYYEADSDKIYDPVKTGNGQYAVGDQPNVCIIILESFGDEWLGKKMGGPYTPFLDSLIDESLYFSNAFANGRKSIEALPAIMGSIPTLLDNPYISSHYGTNQIKALPKLLGDQGYSSAFYHGATNGSMKFDEFANLAGFQNYIGRYEYNNEAHADDTWGILDEYFNPWTAQNISTTLTEPFIAGLFTLSSHHPYFIPEEHQDKFPESEHDIARSIAYGDWSLSLFFEEAKKQDWYNNTIFVLCADHTPAGTEERYTNRIGMYQIPIVIFDPQKRLPVKEEKTIFSHVDIMPTVLDIVGYNGTYYTYGNSYFDTTENNWAVNYISGTYHYFKDDYLLNFNGRKPLKLFNYKHDFMSYHDSLKKHPERVKQMTNELKGIIQRYNYDMINNQMIP